MFIKQCHWGLSSCRYFVVLVASGTNTNFTCKNPNENRSAYCLSLERIRGATMEHTEKCNQFAETHSALCWASTLTMTMIDGHVN